LQELFLVTPAGRPLASSVAQLGVLIDQLWVH